MLEKVVHTDIEGPFRADLSGIRYFHIFVDEVSGDRRVVALKIRDGAAEATGYYLNRILREGISLICIRGDDAGEL